MTRYPCAEPHRLLALQQAGPLSHLNGIEYVEVLDTAAPTRELRQRILHVRLVGPVPAGLDRHNVLVEGGERIPAVTVEWAAPGNSPDVPPELLAGIDEPDRVLVVRTVQRGDFSTYRLRLVADPASGLPYAGFDPLLAEAEFAFKVECPSDFDCAPDRSCPPEPPDTPAIDYLAKDFQGFRRLMLDRISLLAPEWTERNPADVGTTLVELLAYLADGLSYRQDAVATEAYLGTARSRISLRRHARLVDYRVHEGCNARVWVRLGVAGGTAVALPAGTALLTTVPDAPAVLTPGSREHRAALAARPVVFETVEPAVLHADLAEMRFHTWGDRGCCLPAGATSATLRGAHPQLRAGEVLVLAETVSPTTGRAVDADPTRRRAVRLVDVRSSEDPLGGLFEEPRTADPLPVTEIAWHEDDALPFPLCLGVAEGALETARAWGNIVLADHGQSVPGPGSGGEPLGEVPGPRLLRPGGTGRGGTAPPDPVPARYRPALARGPLTHTVAHPAAVLFRQAATAALMAELTAQVYGEELRTLLRSHDRQPTGGTVTVRGADPLWSISDGTTVLRVRLAGEDLLVSEQSPPASAVPAAEPRAARPAVVLTGEQGTDRREWQARPDLLDSPAAAAEFTVETEHDGTVRLRFGDDEHAMRPKEGTRFSARYRVGNGRAGNVGAESITHAVTDVVGIVAVSNPLPAAGGTDPESAEEIRRDAPRAFAVQERAVTEADWAEVTERVGAVQRAAATFRWTGSWHSVFVTADRRGGKPVDADFERDLRARLERYRLAGYDLEVDGPVFVPLEIGLRVCVERTHLRSDVGAAVLARLGDSTLPGGARGLFHPDRLTFGRPVHLSTVLAEVHAVPGVESVDVHTFQRQRLPETSGLETGVLEMGRLEIARLDNDPNFPERGMLGLTLGGGR
ncbi:putative baseplate assembly protein [Kitasatospora sp. DSM 101779]|uniref:putative baseplate assembly protein n=1 Tax=Kitasatospora sp. DSM 101779 TaxID=2853165 RepID=UPI0021D818FC|nr:putative baseplate assembly protein [Kitasatospora sp. DSM 101779]MCU7820357.1 putative baseplate assembly protein [Kitasatospora sp. DSM 101779]